MAGFNLVKTQGSSGYTGKVQTYAFLAADGNLMAVGDAVIVSGTANADGVASITRANGGSGTAITGTIAGFAPDISSLELKGRTASTARLAQIMTDPDAVYELEIGSALAITDVEANFLLTPTAPTTNGSLVRSAMVSGVANATGPLRLIGLKKDPDGVLALGAVGNIGIFTIIRSQSTNLTGV